MKIDKSLIETGIDKLVNIVKERGRVPLADVATELGVSITVVQEWVDFLEEEGIISVDYKLTKPYLIARKLTKKEIEEKVKDFESRKDVFVRKAEVNLHLLEKQAQDLRNVKVEFDQLKAELGLELSTVSRDLSELEKCQQIKQDLQKEIEDQKNGVKLRVEELTKQIMKEKDKYDELIKGIVTEKQELEKERLEAKSLEDSEKMLREKLHDMKATIDLIEKKVADGDVLIRNSQMHIEKLNLMVEGVNKHLEEEKSSIVPLLNENEKHQQRIMELQDKIMRKISLNQKNLVKAQDTTKKVKELFDKRLAVSNMVDKLNKDRDELEHNLIDLIRKAKAFELTDKSSSMGDQMVDLERKFDEVDKKKSFFEKELKNIASFFKRE